MQLKTVYLIIAIFGALIPMTFFASFATEAGIDLIAFIAALFVNGASGGFTADLLISSLVFWIYMFSQQALSNGSAPKPWLFIAVNLFIGLSCALPAYLWAASRSDA